MTRLKSRFPIQGLVRVLIALVLWAQVSHAQSPSADTAREADRMLMAAADKGDATAAGPILDAEFEWTDAAGRSRTRAESLAAFSVLAATLKGENGVQSYNYDSLEVLTGANPNSRFMRVWARRIPGWRLLAMIQTTIVTGTTPPFSVPVSGPAPDCDNPCRNIPFSPATPAQREMLETFMRLKVDEWHPNPDDWAPYVLDDVYYVTSAAMLSKADRVARLAQQRQSGAAALPGDPVLSMRIVEFGPAAVMFARHAPYRGGKPYYSVRVWALRDGRWRFANSQQTVIESATPVPAVQSRH
jgi:hypothetical protein